ncbi:HD domain-containing protein [Spirochaetota bacterium]
MNSLEKNITEKSIDFAKKQMRHLHSSHGWDHVERVLALAKRISEKEKSADAFIVTVSAILHDIARKEQDSNNGKVCHAEMGSKRAYEFLIKEGLDPGRAGHISQCILTHRYRNDHSPQTMEAKILYDADKLDSIGAVGIGRAFLFSGEVGAKLHNADIDISETKSYSKEDTAYREYVFKLKDIKKKMLTEEGRRIALERDSFMKSFFERLQNEVTGKD